MAGASIIKHTWQTTIKNDSGSAVATDTPLVLVGDAEANFAGQVASGQTMEIDVTIPVAKIVSGFVYSDQAVTVNTNAADATGGQSIALSAKKSFGWNNTMVASNPFTPTITKIFIINSGTSTANVRGGFLLNE